MPATIYGSESDLYTASSQQLHMTGQRMMTPDGSVFRYAEMAATVGVANKLYQSSAPVANWLTQALTTAMAVGDTTITQADGGTAFVVDQMAGGTILVEETDDLGHVYRVKSNLATASNATVCMLENGVMVQVAVAVAANNVTTAILNPWKSIIIHPSPPTSLAIGIPRVIIGASGYGWVQTRGVASCLVSGTHVLGQPVAPSNAIDGSLTPKRVSGTATVANGATTAVVTHGLGSTPTLDMVTFTFGEIPTNATTIHEVDTLTATQFTLNVNDPGASNLDFGWSVESNLPVVGYAIEVAPTADFGHIFLTIE